MAASALQRQNWVLIAGTMWHTSPNYLLSGLLPKMSCLRLEYASEFPTWRVRKVGCLSWSSAPQRLSAAHRGCCAHGQKMYKRIWAPTAVGPVRRQPSWVPANNRHLIKPAPFPSHPRLVVLHPGNFCISITQMLLRSIGAIWYMNQQDVLTCWVWEKPRYQYCFFLWFLVVGIWLLNYFVYHCRAFLIPTPPV